MTRILHLYWDCNQPLSFLRSLTVTSFARLHPDWQIKVWVPKERNEKEHQWATGEQSKKYKGPDYLETISQYLCSVDFNKLQIPNDMPAVHKADLLRWYLLGTAGGVWSDFDILYVKALPDIPPGVGLCRYKALPNSDRLFTVIGFLTSQDSYGKQFFNELFQFGLSHIPQSAYQAYGAMLLDEFITRPATFAPVFYICPEWVYPHKNSAAYFRPFGLQKQNVIGYHWYAGSPLAGEHEVKINHENIIFKANQYAICKVAMEEVLS